MINQYNYESYLFRYQEGELDDIERKEVERFLQEHPDIREEMDTYYDPTLVVTAEPPARKSARITHLWRWAAAACVALALGYGVFLTLPQPKENGTLIAETSPKAPHFDTAPTDTKEIPTTSTSVRVSASSHSIPASEPVPTISPLPALKERDLACLVPVELAPISQPDPAPTPSTILVDDLARVIPGVKAERKPPVLNLAMIIKQTIDIKQQEIVDFVHKVFHINDNQELAEAY